MFRFSPEIPWKKRLTFLSPLVVILLYSITSISRGHYWVEAWETSKKIQKSFETQVVPMLKMPGAAYFFGIPEYKNGVIYFPLGLPDCFSLLDERKGYSYIVASRFIRSEVRFPETATCESKLPNYYLFEWDSANGKFQHLGTFIRDSQASRDDGDMSDSFEFSSQHVFRLWELANDLTVIFAPDHKSKRFLTTGNSSFLKSPVLDTRVKCVRITCKVTNPKRIPLSGQLFWVTESDRTYDGNKSIIFPVQNDESFHTYTLPLYINAWSIREPVLRLAFRLSDKPNTIIEIASITVNSY